MVVAKKYVVVKPFLGEPKITDFAIEEETLPSLKYGEFLAEAKYLSVDPYQRLKLGSSFPCDMIGGQLAKIIESQNQEYPVGTWVMGHFGWRTHTVFNPSDAHKGAQQPFLYKLPDFGDLPISLGIGVLGRVGVCAYFGLKEVCQPKAKETLVVSGAAGAVGSLVGQMGKILGLKVIGIAGSKEKCNWLKDIGFDCAINYKTDDIPVLLKSAAPEGIDCYFDNVGGEISSTVISQMNPFGRVAVCGSISGYNETSAEKLKVSPILMHVVKNQLKIEGFQTNRFAARTMEGIQKNMEWVKQGTLKYKDHVWDGFDNAPRAFIGMFKGENIGKTVVRL